MARTGYVYFDESTTRWTARVTFTDSNGKKRNVRRVADSESKAQKLLRKLLNDLETKGEKTIDAEKMTLTTKTRTERFVPISERLASELKSLYARFSDRDLVFGITPKFQHSWETACKLASLADLRFHDLRATFCTRLINAGMPIEQVAKLSGHTQLETLYKHYLSTTQEALNKATELLNQMNESKR
jgi:integrase